MLSASVQAVVRNVAKENNIPFANLAALVEVESAGQVFAIVDGQQEPLFRWEGHYFYKRLSGAKRDQAVRLGLAHPKAGAVKNPRKQQARWDKLLVPATQIDESAALESCSWGVGQVMGSHWKSLGYSSVQQMVRVARSGLDGQLDLVVRYLKRNYLMDEIRESDWKGLARGYNGPLYAKWSYDTKLAYAARKYGGTAKASSGMLTIGAKGYEVRELQKLLVRAGYSIKVDGDFGPSTRTAVRQFQRDNGLQVDGKVGPNTQAALEKYRQPNEDLGKVSPIEAATETDEGRVGTVTSACGVGTGVAADTVQNAADNLTPAIGSSPWIDTAYTVLTVVATIMVIGGLAYAAYGWWKANRKNDD